MRPARDLEADLILKARGQLQVNLAWALESRYAVAKTQKENSVMNYVNILDESSASRMKTLRSTNGCRTRRGVINDGDTVIHHELVGLPKILFS